MNTGFSCYSVTPLPPCLPLDIKDSLKEDAGFFDGGWIDWWAAWENATTDGLLRYAPD
jgi:hypothetical protein